MVRMTLIEEPADSAALFAVKSKIDEARTAVVRVVHNTAAQLSGARADDLASGLATLEERLRPGKFEIESVDLVGHGSPGVIMIGSTALKKAPKLIQRGTSDWAVLDTDINKIRHLAPFSEKLDAWEARGLLAPEFEVRLIGCNTAVDPGGIAREKVRTMQNGAVLIHMLAGYLGRRVSGALQYIGAEDFDSSGFISGHLLRSCHHDRASSEVSFAPRSLAASGLDDAKPQGSLSLAEVAELAEPALEDLLQHFEQDARELRSAAPLVVTDASIAVGSELVVDVAEQGKALVIHARGACYRARPVKGGKSSGAAVAEAQRASIFFLERIGVAVDWVDASILV
jgi:hypothetical protein